MLGTSSQTLNLLSQTSLFPIIEFAALFVVVGTTYLALIRLNVKLKRPIKALTAVLMGTLAYTLGKALVIAFLIGPTFN